MPQHMRDLHFSHAALAYGMAWAFTNLPSGPASLFAPDRRRWAEAAATQLDIIGEPWFG